MDIIIPDKIGFPDDGGCFLQSPEEMDQLVALLTDKQLKFVIEIGTGFGGTAFVWAQLVQPQEGLVLTIDTVSFPNMWGKGTKFEFYIKRLQGDSHDPDILNQVNNFVPYADMLFIDGDHYGAKKDFDMYSPLVKNPGGIIILHDIREIGYKLEVPALWNNLKSIYSHTKEIIGTLPISFTKTKEAPGIGVIFLE